MAFTHPILFPTRPRFFIVLSLEMLSVAVGWQGLRDHPPATGPGYVGLAQFLPGFALFLFAGHAADLFDRDACYVVLRRLRSLLGAAPAISWQRHIRHLIYAVLVLLGAFRSFNFPASRALLPQLVPEKHFANAVAWNSSIFQIATLRSRARGIVYAIFRRRIRCTQCRSMLDLCDGNDMRIRILTAARSQER